MSAKQRPMQIAPRIHIHNNKEDIRRNHPRITMPSVTLAQRVKESIAINLYCINIQYKLSKTTREYCYASNSHVEV